jgi:radical SAM superfamily enzyme YgiQ (UPF0313 family)
MYRTKRFALRPEKEILEDIEFASRLQPETRRVFLLDGDALTAPTRRLVGVLDALGRAFPDLARVGSYVNAVSILGKSDAELEELRAQRLTIGYLGLESGHEPTNERIVKGATVDEQVEAVVRAQRAGIKMSVMVLLGIAGRAESLAHARATAEALNRMDPRYVSCLCVTPVPGTPLFDDVEAGRFELPSPPELLRELRELVAGLALSGAVFRSNHASNWLALGGRLPADKERLLAAIDLALAGEIPLRPERLRGL